MLKIRVPHVVTRNGKFGGKLDFGQNIGSEMLFTLRYTLRIIEKLNKEENESKFTGFGALKPVKSIGFVVVFQEISENFMCQKIDDPKFYLASLPEIFERKDSGFVRFTLRSDDPENLSKNIEFEKS